MRSPQLILSLNEVYFYFTRAAVGAGVPYGLAEDFGQASAWVAGNGLDPAQTTVPALHTVDNHPNSLGAILSENDDEVQLVSSTNNPLSALQAGSATCDWTGTQTQAVARSQRFVAKNVDCPFLIVAALGAAGCHGWDIAWQDANENRYLVSMTADGTWNAAWSGSTPPEQSGSGEVIVTPMGNASSSSEAWPHHAHYSHENRFRALESGSPVHEQWPTVYRLFSRCLVPSTQRSRQVGAGFDETD